MPAPIPQNPDALGTSAHFAAYADASAPIDIVAEGRSNCRRIRVGGEGTLVVKRASDGAQVTLTFLAGETMEVSARSIDSGSATNIVVFW
jgi:hypothetical protein